MERLKLLTFCVAALVVLNIGTLIFVCFNPAKTAHPDFAGRPEPKEIIIQRLKFDETQQREYTKLIGWHRSRIHEIESKIRGSKNELYLLLNQPERSNTKKDSIIQNLALLQREIENTHFKHFTDIRNLCRPEQMKDFDALSAELALIFSGPSRPRH